MKKLLQQTLLAGAIICSSIAFTQDVQFSQYYASATHLNPSFAAVPDNFKTGVQYRHQWNGLGTPYTAMFGHAEHLFEKAKSGVGLSFLNSSEGAGKLSTTDVSAYYAFKIKAGKNLSIIPSLQGAYLSRSINDKDLVWNDQITKAGATGTSSEIIENNNISSPDFGAGLLLLHKKYFLGGAINHIAEPNLSFYGGEDLLYKKIMLHGGYMIPLAGEDTEKSILFNALYKSQGTADQLDAGMYLNIRPITLGAWYRGIPVSQYNDLINHESFVFLAGLIIKKMKIAYSYDMVISQLNSANVPVHEISLNYEFHIKKPEKEPKMGLPIPLF